MSIDSTVLTEPIKAKIMANFDRKIQILQDKIQINQIGIRCIETDLCEIDDSLSDLEKSIVEKVIQINCYAHAKILLNNIDELNNAILKGEPLSIMMIIEEYKNISAPL